MPRLLGPRIFDGLRLIDHGQPPVKILQHRLAQQGTIAGDDQINALQLRRIECLEIGSRHRRRMGNQQAQARGETFGLRRPVGQQRSWCHQQAGALRSGTFAFEHQQQRQHLNRLAQPHVVGQASTQPKPRQQIQPLHTCLLVGPQAGLESVTGVDPRQAFGLSQALQGFGQPRAGDQLRPVGVQTVAGIFNRCACHQPHGLGKRQAVVCRRLLDGPEALQHAFERLFIHLDPATANQLQAVAACQQGLQLGFAQALAVQRHVHLEVQQRLLAQQRRHTGADTGLDHRTCRSAGAPGAGCANDDAGGFELGHVGQKLVSLGGAPAQRMVNVAGLDHLVQPVAMLGGALHRQQQRQQLRPASVAGKLRQRLRQRLVLRVALGRQARGVGGQKGEGRFRVFAVFCQIEMHAADQVPGRMTRLEEILQQHPGGGQFMVQGCVDLLPQPGQHVGRQVFRARHGRCAGDALREFIRRRRGDGYLAAFGRGAHGGHIAHRHIAPPGPGGRQNAADLRASQLQQAVPAAQRKRGCEGLTQVVSQRRCIMLCHGQQVASGCQLRRKVGGGVGCVHIRSISQSVSCSRQAGIPLA